MVKLPFPKSSGSFGARARKGAAICGLVAFAGGCAQEPPPATTAPDDCILLCALVRSITGEPEPAPPAPPPKPAKPVHAATKKKPVPARPKAHHRHHRKHGPQAPVADVQDPVRGTEQPAVEESTIERAPALQPNADPGPAPLNLVPGSAPIAEVTTRFMPMPEQH